MEPRLPWPYAASPNKSRHASAVRPRIPSLAPDTSFTSCFTIEASSKRFSKASFSLLDGSKPLQQTHRRKTGTFKTGWILYENGHGGKMACVDTCNREN